MHVDSYKAVALLTPVAVTTTTNHTGVDLGGYASQANRAVKFLVHAGGVAGTSPSIVFSVEESDSSGSGYAAPTAGTTSATAITTNGLVQFDTFIAKRYVRLVSTYTSNTTSAIVGATVLVMKRDTAL
jgi:hypothetical protein